ncbi:MAG TPA: (4Fe-4S)-binding protein, partial [bacterium]|nr:(4Fe-4S)-binding protein [bacterium]
MITSEEVKEVGKRCGADLVGIASMDRFEGAPKQMDPRYINPDAKALIVFGFRIHRGLLRGIEEGTYFSGYTSMGYGGINTVFAPLVLRQVCNFIEDNGYESTAYPNPLVAVAVDIATGEFKKGWSRPVSPEKPAPDVFIHFRIAAFCAGLGEIGYSKVFLTPEFGPRQRFACILTDAP